MSVTPIITLITDFGEKDYFVGSMKGVILNINPDVTIVDISHDISSQDIVEASFVLKSIYKYFPSHTIHVVVVDPGVGGRRRPILVTSSNYYFVAPDNGVLSYIYKEDQPVKVREITSEHYFMKSHGETFHGRDIFAPIAARISKGVETSHIGEEIKDYTILKLNEPKLTDKNSLHGRIIHIDKFGNMITNITNEHLYNSFGYKKEMNFKIIIKEIVITGLNNFYAEGERGVPSALINSSGHLEIYSFMNNAKKILNGAIRDEVIVRVE
ncbi:MAG: S-adenosyl-l-methionine hydroxide adenosyltransferase family protein [Nitrospirota bacterium]